MIEDRTIIDSSKDLKIIFTLHLPKPVKGYTHENGSVQ